MSSDFSFLSVFLSRRPEPLGPFDQLLKHPGVKLIAEPLIRTTKIPFSHTPQTKWIFFSSKNAIRYFFEQSPQLPEGVRYGVVSSASEAYLQSFGKSSDFVGHGTDLLKIAKDFADVLGNDSVLFPQAMDSLRTIQKQIAFTNTLYNLYTYKTIIRDDFDIPYTDVLIFTSPSNVEAYLRKYKIDLRQTVIAMGSSTKFKLAQHGIRRILTPVLLNEQGLYDLLIEVIGVKNLK